MYVCLTIAPRFVSSSGKARSIFVGARFRLVPSAVEAGSVLVGTGLGGGRLGRGGATLGGPPVVPVIYALRSALYRVI